MISICINGLIVKELSVSEFEEESENLLNAINSKTSKGAFSVEGTQNFMNKILCYKLSAPATDKSDITVKIIDINTGLQSYCRVFNKIRAWFFSYFIKCR